MARPRYVARRLDRLEAAHTAALAIPDAALAAELADERDRLGAASWEVSDATVRDRARQVLADWAAQGQGALAAIAEDPVLLALGAAPETTAAFDLLPGLAPAGDPDGAWLESFRAALVAAAGATVGTAAFDEAVLAAYRSWFLAGPHPYPFDDVVVLLPVRLETYFPDDGHLRLRVLPDEASIRRDVPTVAPDEAAALAEFWLAALKASGAATWHQPAHALFARPDTGPAWQRLADQVTPGRAAWLLTAFPPTPHSLATGTPEVSIPAASRGPASSFGNRVAGFPETLEVWAVWGDDPALRRLTPTMPPAPIDPENLALDGERIDASRRHLAGETVPVAERAWWMEWDAAEAVGLGLTFDLPEGCTTATLRAIYVTGRSEETPAELFGAHAQAGELALLPLGMPTNAVTGSETAPAPSPDDPGAWREVAARRLERAGQPPTGLTSQTARFLTGDAAALTTVPGEATMLIEDMPDMSFILARGLWPALRGHLWRDIRGLRDNAEHLRSWAQSNLRPEGPWNPIRIGDQPYGLLPISLIDDWQVEFDLLDHGVRVEESLSRQLGPLRDAWAAAARRAGTARGRDAAGFLDLLGRDAVAGRYAYRWYRPAEFFAVPYLLEGQLAPDAAAFMDGLRQAYVSLEGTLGVGMPERFYLSRGGPTDLELPLVRPTGWQGELKLKAVVNAIAKGFGAFEALEFYIGREEIPRSLLVRLLIHAAFMATGAMGQEQEEQRPGGAQLKLLNPLVWYDPSFTSVELARDSYNPSPAEPQSQQDVLGHIDFVATMLDELQRNWDAPDSLPEAERNAFRRREAGLERALRATLDGAAHRIDPWITGLATRRLSATVDAPTKAYRLGVYGWVEGPMVGSPGPTAAGLLHTPSHAQTLAAVILRDKYLSARLEGDADPDNPWAMTLDSRTVRLAEELADEVRSGSHPYEALGRRVEAAVGSSAGVAALRQTFPLRPSAVPQDPNSTCDGFAALAPGATWPPGLLTGLDAVEKAKIELLRRTVDVYGDLLVAEAVYSVVSGRPAGANAAMEAAAGLGKPPDLEIVRTPDSGVALKSSVIALLPAAPAPEGDAGPAAIADPAVAAWIGQALGGGWTWPLAWWRNGPPAVGTPPDATDSVTLAAMDLTPAEAALMADDLLGGIATAIGRARLPELIPGLTETEAAAAYVEATTPDRHAQARSLVVLLGGPPATAEDIAVTAAAAQPADTTWMAPFDAAVAAELRDRYQHLRTAAENLASALEATASPDAVRRALTWGVLPGSAPEAQAEALAWLYAGGPLAADGAKALADAAAAALRRRLDAAPPPDPAPAAVADLELAERRLQRPQELARAIAELGAADGRMAVLARIDRAALAVRCPLAPDPELEAGWLTTLAAVRRDLAQLEAWNLEAATGAAAAPPAFAPLSTAPRDPWQTEAATAALAQRAAADADRLAPWTPHLVAAFAAPGWQAGAAVAVGLVDGWTETVPTLRRSTRAAFGFNAPAARPPQAILLAVPPTPRTWLGPELLARIVAEAHTLTHVRAARLEDIAAYYSERAAAGPPGDPLPPFHEITATMMMSTAGPTGITLVDTPLWE